MVNNILFNDVSPEYFDLFELSIELNRATNFEELFGLLLKCLSTTFYYQHPIYIEEEILEYIGKESNCEDDFNKLKKCNFLCNRNLLLVKLFEEDYVFFECLLRKIKEFKYED